MLRLGYSRQIVDLRIKGGKVLFDDIGQFCNLNRPIVEDSFSFCDCARQCWASDRLVDAYVEPTSPAFPLFL